jgi:hypothetical protein
VFRLLRAVFTFLQPPLKVKMCRHFQNLFDQDMLNNLCNKYKNKFTKNSEIHIYNKKEYNIQGLPELADQNNTVTSLSSENNRKNIFKNPSSLDFKTRTFLIDQSRVDIKLP